MNGTIEAFARDGGGARFVITLPVAQADAEPDAEPRAPTGGAA